MILLDSHVVIWLGGDASRLSAHAAVAIERARLERSGLAISDITLAELATSYSKRRLTLTVPVDVYLDETESRFAVYPITARIAAQTAIFPGSFPRDPADRIITATALVHGLPLVTADRAIRRSKLIRTIW